MPNTSSVCEAPWCTGEESGMRARTIRFAAAASDALRTVNPFASRAVMVLFTRPSFALVPHRRVSDPSGSSSTSFITRNLLPWTIYLRLQVSYPLVIAYASTFETGHRRSFRSDPGERGARGTRVAGVGRPAPGPRHASAPARDRSGKQDRSGSGRLRRAGSAGHRWRFAADDRAGGPGPHFTLRYDSARHPAPPRRPGSSRPRRCRRARCRGPVDKLRIGPSDRRSSGPPARSLRSIPHEAGRPGARRSRERPCQGHPRLHLWLRRRCGADGEPERPVLATVLGISRAGRREEGPESGRVSARADSRSPEPRFRGNASPFLVGSSPDRSHELPSLVHQAAPPIAGGRLDSHPLLRRFAVTGIEWFTQS